jgi:hypothetical protein
MDDPFKMVNLPSVAASGLDQSCVVFVYFGDAPVCQDHGVLDDLRSVSSNNVTLTPPKS